MQHEIHDSAYHAQQAIERGEQIVVGVNAFESDESIGLERMKVDPSIELTQRERLASLRARRNSERAASLLVRLGEAADSDENLMPLFIECVEADITLGEICSVLREKWGEYQQTVTI